MAVRTEKVTAYRPQGEDPAAGHPVVQGLFFDGVHGGAGQPVIQGEKVPRNVLPHAAGANIARWDKALSGTEDTTDFITGRRPEQGEPFHGG